VQCKDYSCVFLFYNHIFYSFILVPYAAGMLYLFKAKNGIYRASMINYIFDKYILLCSIMFYLLCFVMFYLLCFIYYVLLCFIMFLIYVFYVSEDMN